MSKPDMLCGQMLPFTGMRSVELKAFKYSRLATDCAGEISMRDGQPYWIQLEPRITGFFGFSIPASWSYTHDREGRLNNRQAELVFLMTDARRNWLPLQVNWLIFSYFDDEHTECVAELKQLRELEIYAWHIWL